MCIFRVGDGRRYVAAWSLGSLPASSGGPALCGAVGAVWRGKASVSQGAVPARRCSLPGGLWRRAGPPPWVLSLRRKTGKGIFEGEIVSACLSSTARSPQHLPSCGSLCRCDSSFFQTEPLRPRRLGSQRGCYRGSCGEDPAFERESMDFVHRSHGGWGVEHGTGLLAGSLHLPSSASPAAISPPFLSFPTQCIAPLLLLQASAGRLRHRVQMAARRAGAQAKSSRQLSPA